MKFVAGDPSARFTAATRAPSASVLHVAPVTSQPALRVIHPASRAACVGAASVAPGRGAKPRVTVSSFGMVAATASSSKKRATSSCHSARRTQLRSRNTARSTRQASTRRSCSRSRRSMSALCTRVTSASAVSSSKRRSSSGRSPDHHRCIGRSPRRSWRTAEGTHDRAAPRTSSETSSPTGSDLRAVSTCRPARAVIDGASAG